MGSITVMDRGVVGKLMVKGGVGQHDETGRKSMFLLFCWHCLLLWVLVGRCVKLYS